MKQYKELIIEDNFPEVEIKRKHGYKNKTISYLNIPCGFDIETSSLYVSEDHQKQMTNKEHMEYIEHHKLNDDFQKFSFMYIWMFGVGDQDHICYGRTWEEFIELCEYLQDHYGLNENKRLICYIQNLSYEFQFMRRYIPITEVFATGKGKPLKVMTEYGIEFRDSYKLSGFSLKKMAENLQSHSIKKLVGDLDYSLIRTSETPLTDQELLYCEYDVLIILYYIEEEIANYDNNIIKIPLTNTGRVRQFVRNACFFNGQHTDHKDTKAKREHQRYNKMIHDLTIEPEEYFMLHRAMQGGYTHANFYRVNKTIENVHSIDFTSSYPTVMLLEAFPMSKGEKIDCKTLSKEKFDYYRSHYCCIFDITYINLRTKMSYDNYLSSSKCECDPDSLEVNNGRIYSCDYVKTTITEVDYDIIKRCYSYDGFQVTNMYIYRKGPLPTPIKKCIIELYKKKTELKGVKGKEEEYLRSKGMLNSIYGMTVTDTIQAKADYINNEWSEEPITIEEVLENLDKENKSKNRFLFYPWGVYTTAYARRNLWHGIVNIKEDYIYSDTDSIKFTNYEDHIEYIEAYNNDVLTRSKKMCLSIGLPEDTLSPKTIKGVKKPLGVWDYEGASEKFKTLGAKRYLTYDGNDLHLTVAGLSKSNGIKYMKEVTHNNIDDVFDLFQDDLYVPSDRTGKNTHTFIDEPITCYIKDYKGHVALADARSGIHLEEASFTLSMSSVYIDFICNYVNGCRYFGMTEGEWNIE